MAYYDSDEDDRNAFQVMHDLVKQGPGRYQTAQTASWRSKQKKALRWRALLPHEQAHITIIITINLITIMITITITSTIAIPSNILINSNSISLLLVISVLLSHQIPSSQNQAVHADRHQNLRDFLSRGKVAVRRLALAAADRSGWVLFRRPVTRKIGSQPYVAHFGSRLKADRARAGRDREAARRSLDAAQERACSPDREEGKRESEPCSKHDPCPRSLRSRKGSESQGSPPPEEHR